jgi:hypothetical protein
MEDFNKTLDKISVKYDNVILIGDLNYNVSIVPHSMLFFLSHAKSDLI